MEKTNNLEWKVGPKDNGNRLHTICSYMAMYPPTIPYYFLKKYSDVDSVILDPFCGRGTTLLEACLLGRKTVIGNDKNPLATVLSKAKVDIPTRSRIATRLKQLEDMYDSKDVDVSGIDEKISMIYSDYTLKQLVYLKKTLKWKTSNVDNFIAAMLLGIMHGGTVGYLSVSMPNTFSMSPNYIKKYIKEHELGKPKRDSFELLRRKLDRCYQECKKKGKVYCQDARNISRVDDSAIDLIITSPPYTRLITYGKFNWIRLWFLGKEGAEVDEDLFVTQSLPKYCDFMREVLKEFKRVLKTGGKSVLVVGDVKKRESEEITNLAEIVWTECARPLGFTKVGKILEDVIGDKTDGNPKVSRIWGERKGNATKIDRILVLKK